MNEWEKMDDILIWALIVLACLWFGHEVSAWAMRGFEVLGK